MSVPTPVLAAAMVSALVFTAVRYGLPVSPLYLLVPPLVTFLPGAMLAFGMVELAYGDMVSGASRLVAGLVQLLLLAFGLAAGATAGRRRAREPDRIGHEGRRSRAGRRGPAQWCSPSASRCTSRHPATPLAGCCWWCWRRSARSALASIVFGSEISGFFGTLVAMPLAYLVQTRFKGPPVAVTFLPSFWMLVPGSLGLLASRAC